MMAITLSTVHIFLNMRLYLGAPLSLRCNVVILIYIYIYISFVWHVCIVAGYFGQLGSAASSCACVSAFSLNSGTKSLNTVCKFGL